MEKYFVFYNPWDETVTEWIQNNLAAEFAVIAAASRTKVERDLKEAFNEDNCGYDSFEQFLAHNLTEDTAAEMEGDLCELFCNESPITCFPECGGCGADIYEDLLSDAVSKIDFENVAKAILLGVCRKEEAEVAAD